MKMLPQGSLVSSSQLRLMDAIGQGIQNIASNMFVNDMFSYIHVPQVNLE